MTFSKNTDPIGLYLPLSCGQNLKLWGPHLPKSALIILPRSSSLLLLLVTNVSRLCFECSADPLLPSTSWWPSVHLLRVRSNSLSLWSLGTVTWLKLALDALHLLPKPLSIFLYWIECSALGCVSADLDASLDIAYSSLDPWANQSLMFLVGLTVAQVNEWACSEWSFMKSLSIGRGLLRLRDHNDQEAR